MIIMVMNLIVIIMVVIMILVIIIICVISIVEILNFEPSFRLLWDCARDLCRSQIPVTTRGFELKFLHTK